jgi:hypothetical protein
MLAPLARRPSSPGRCPGTRRRGPGHRLPGPPSAPPSSATPPAQPTSSWDPTPYCATITLPVSMTVARMGSRGSPCTRTVMSTPPSPLSMIRGSALRHELSLPVLRDELGQVAHPPLTVIGQAVHPVQGEGHQGSHPPGQEDSEAKPFWTGQSWSCSSSSRPGTSSSVRENEIKSSIKMTTAKPGTSPNSSILTGSKLGRKFDNKEEEERRRKMEHIRKKKEDTSKKRTTYLLGPESETSPVPPRSSSSEPTGSSRWSPSSPGSAEALHTPEGSSGRGEGDQGSQDIFKGDINSPTLCEQNCQTAAYICTANIVEGILNSGDGRRLRYWTRTCRPMGRTELTVI